MARRRRPPRRGRNPDLGALYPTLDLHGETAESARRAAELWLRNQQRLGERWVRLVTGRGKHSRAGPVLRDEIGDLLLELQGALVAAAELEGSGGAYRVELRAPARKVTRALPALPDVPPELRQQAEEALAELGVDPRPELLAAEIRRLLREREG